MEQVAAGVWRGGTRYVGWYLVDGGGDDGLTVVDAGLPGYRGRLQADLASIGRSVADVRAVLLTHGHVDHTGMAVALAEGGAPVHLHAADDGLARDPSQGSTDAPLRRYLWWPATAAFVAHAVRNGAAAPRELPATVPLVDGEVLDVPGRPRVVHAPGHTPGSCAFAFPEHGAVVIGDLLCTADPFSGRRVAPQLQTRGSNTDSALALASLERLGGVEERLVLPGHGTPWYDGVEAAVASARRVGCR